MMELALFPVQGFDLVTAILMEQALRMGIYLMVDPSYEAELYRLAAAEWMNPRLVDATELQ